MSLLEWNEFYEELIVFNKLHKHTNVPKNYKANNLDLGTWVRKQRASYQTKTKNFNKEKVKKLENIDSWTWNLKEDNWDNNFNILKLWIDEGNTFNDVLPRKYKGLNLYNFVNIQRQSYKENWNSMTNEKKSKLESLEGWYWVKKQNQIWFDNAELVSKISRKTEQFPTSSQLSKYGKNYPGWILAQKKSTKKINLQKSRF